MGILSKLLFIFSCCVDKVREVRKCPACKRHLHLGLYNSETGVCLNCARRQAGAKEIREKRHGLVQFSVNNTFITQNIPAEPNHIDPLTYMQSIMQDLCTILRDAMRMHGAIKKFLTINMNMERLVGSEIVEDLGHFCSIPCLILNEDEIVEQLEKAINLALERADAFLRYGSGWVFKGVKSVDINSCAYNIIGGTSYIETPPRLKNRSIINIQNKDEKCFEYSVLAGMYPAKRNVCHPSTYKKYMGTLNFDGISLPVKPTKNQIEKFETQNPEISINVQHIDMDGRLGTIFASKQRGRKHHINLLLLNESVAISPTGIETKWDGKSEIPEGHCIKHKSHYTLVKNLSSLVRARTNQKNKVHVCVYCLSCFSKKHVLDKHLEACSRHSPCRITFPSNYIKNKTSKTATNEEESDFQTLEEAL